MGSEHGPLRGGQPAAYWRLPFEERCRYHAPPGVTVRDASKVGLVPEASPQDGLSRARLRDKVLSLDVTERKASEGFPERRCLTCGHPLPPGVTALNWQVSDDAAWLDLSPPNGVCTTGTDAVTVTIDITGLPIDTYSATITVADANASNSPVNVPVTLRVAGPGIWVGKEGDDSTGDGSYDTPYLTIGMAMSVAAAGDTVMVKPGTYVESVVVTQDNLMLESEGGAEVTVMESTGGSNVPTVDITGTSGVSIAGFTVTNGFPGIDADSAAGFEIRDCILVDNVHRGIAATYVTGGVIEGNVFTRNHFSGSGALEGTGLQLRVGTSTPADTVVANNLFYRNDDDGVDLRNFTDTNALFFANNDVVFSEESGIVLWGSENGMNNTYLYNNIVACNAESGVEQFSGYAPRTICNNVHGNGLDYAVMADQTGINGNISSDPLFLDSGWDFRIAATSLCRDAGWNAVPGLPSTDFRGAPRIENGVVDMGCYERDPVLDAMANIVASPSEFAFRGFTGLTAPSLQCLRVWNSGETELNWQITDDAPWLEAQPASGTCTEGIDHVTLSVTTDGLDVGEYAATVAVSDPNACNSPCNVRVTLTVGGTVWVATDGSDTTGDGSYGNPYGTIGKGMEVVSSGEAVGVKPGTYQEKVQIPSVNVSLISEQGAGVTTIQGTGFGAESGVSGPGSPWPTGMVVDGFTIRMWYSGVYSCDGATVTDCVIEDNRSTGVMINYGKNSFVVGNVVRNNACGITCGGSSNGSYASLVANNLVVSNDGFGLYLDGYSNMDQNEVVTVENNTVAYNGGDGVSFWNAGAVLLRGNIVAFNGGYGMGSTAYYSPEVYACNVYGNTGGYYHVDVGDRTGADGNISADPVFVGPTDYRIGSSSPCRDRVVNGTVDMGCYEWQAGDP